MENKAKVYQDVICLEVQSVYGAKWWMQTLNNNYTPILVEDIKRLQFGVLRGSAKEILVTPIEISGKPQLIAVNLARSDIPALKSRRLWPDFMEEPFSSYHYTPWPAGVDKSDIRL